MGNDTIGRVGDVTGDAGLVAGKAGGVVGDMFSNFSLYLANMGLVEWILLAIVGLGGFIVWSLKKKYNLKFTWGPKKPKKTFN